MADVVSTVAVGAQLSLSTVDAFKQPNKKEAFLELGCRNALALGAAELVKLIIKRPRPDESDNKSYYSMHTTLLAANRGWNYSIGWSLTWGGGILRGAADKHYQTDILSGAITGWGFDKFCGDWID